MKSQRRRSRNTNKMTSEHREDIMESLEEMIADFALDKGVKEFEHGSGTLSYGQVIDALTLAHREYSYHYFPSPYAPSHKDFEVKLILDGMEYDPRIYMFSDKKLFLFPHYVTSSNFRTRNGESKQVSIESELLDIKNDLRDKWKSIEKSLDKESYEKEKGVYSHYNSLLHSIYELKERYLKNGREELKSKTKFNEDYNLYELPIKFIYEKSKKKIEEYK